MEYEAKVTLCVLYIITVTHNCNAHEKKIYSSAIKLTFIPVSILQQAILFVSNNRKYGVGEGFAERLYEDLIFRGSVEGSLGFITG